MGEAVNDLMDRYLERGKRIEKLEAVLDEIEGLQRWEQGESIGYALGNAAMAKDPDGEYVEYDEIEAIIKRQSE